MRTKLICMALLGALTTPFALAAPGDGAMPDMPDASVYGLCTAWAHNEEGRERGQAGNAGPFRWLQQQAEENDQTVEEWCADNAPGTPP